MSSSSRVAVELHGKDPLGDGLVHSVAYSVARTIMWMLNGRRRLANTRVISTSFTP